MTVAARRDVTNHRAMRYTTVNPRLRMTGRRWEEAHDAPAQGHHHGSALTLTSLVYSLICCHTECVAFFSPEICHLDAWPRPSVGCGSDAPTA